MIKQSKTTIKELTAQYRAVLKHAFFAGIAAVAVSTTGAMAAINVEPGETDITSGVINAINTSINNNAPDKSKFSYTAPDGTTTIKLSDDTQYKAADYKTDSTSKDNTYGITGPTSVNWESNLTAANYTYTPLTADGTAGTPVTGDTAVNHLTKTVETSALHSLYSGASLALSSDSTATETLNTLDYSTTSGGNSYYLYKDGADFKLVTDKANPTTTIVTDPSAIGVSGVLNDLTEAYKGDAEKVANIQKTLNDSYKTNTDSYDYINNTTTGYLAKDKASAAALKINKESLDTANSGFNTAQTNYNGSVGQAIDGHILNKDGAVAKLFNEKEAWVGEQLGYDTTKTDARTELQKAKDGDNQLFTENVDSFLDAVVANKKDINANTDAIARLNGNAETEGSIDNKIAANNQTITATVTGLISEKETNLSNQFGYDVTKSTGDEQLYVKGNNLEATYEAANANYLKDAKTLAAADIALDTQIKTNADNIDSLTEYVGHHSSEGQEATGLTMQVENNASQITTLMGSESITGSVKNTVKIAVDAEATARENGDATTLASAKSYADERDAITLASAKAYADDQDAVTLSSAKSYADAGDAKLQSAIDANRNDIAALDSKMNDLDDNLSAGIASSVALSSVAVANVQKGELSVGGGYGNYNSKSAVAFGAALGISDNWSANAGVGLGFGNGSKASFRVGTNYKFRLF